MPMDRRGTTTRLQEGYRRVGVERVMGICTEERAKGFLQGVLR